MAASSVAKWDIMPTIAPSTTCKPPKTRGTVDKDRINNNHNSTPRNNNQTPQGNKGYQNYVRGRVNHVAAEIAQEA